MTTRALPSFSRYEMILKRILSAAVFMAAGFLLARIQLIGALCPFGPAFIAACFLSKRIETLIAAAGVCLGSLLVPENTLHILFLTVLLCAVLLFIKQGSIRRWMVLITTAAAYALGAAIFRSQDINTFMMAVLECLLALIMIYVLHTIMQMIINHSKRGVFSAEETISLCMGALIIVCMPGPLNIAGVYIANIIALFLVVCVAYTGGAALGAGVGLALGMACCLGIAAEVTVIGMFGIAGMVAGMVNKLKKTGTAICFMLINLLFIIAFYNAAVWYLVLIETAAAAILFLAVPKKVFAFAAKYFNKKTRHEYEYKLHSKRFEELTAGRLQEVSQVFLQTGEMFVKEAAQNMHKGADISGALSKVAEDTCRDCVFRKSCWDEDFINTYNVFNKLFIKYEKKGRLARSDVDQAFAKKCFNIEGILNVAESVFNSYLLNIKWKKKIEESRLVTGKQLKGVAKVVADIGHEINTGFAFLESVEQNIAASLDAVGIQVKEVCAESAAGGGIIVGLKVKNYEELNDCGQKLESVLCSVCGVGMKRTKAEQQAKGKLCTLRFEQARKFAVETRTAAAAKGSVSGDSYSYSNLKNGNYIVMLCDGMGSGERAKRESAAAVSLVENFYQAGFDDTIIFDTINRLLILKGNEEIFSTVDLCVVNLRTGSAKFTKIGGECSYILSGKGIATIAPGSLPIGILEEAAPVSTQKNVAVNDMIIMISDGVSDNIRQPPSAWFADIPVSDAQQTADAILAKALKSGNPKDDMSVVVSIITQG